MRSEKFTDLLSEIVDNRGRTCPVGDLGIPLIATNCVRNDLLYPALETTRFVDQRTYDTWFRGHPQPGDIIFVCKGSPGRVCLAPGPVGFCIAQDMVAVRPDPTKVYPKFLFALLRSREVQERIGNLHVGTLIPHFKKGDFDKLMLDLPDAVTQQFAGDLYFALSAKVDKIRRMNIALQELSQAIFKSVFVDFDGHNDLFDREIGPLPRGWSIQPLDEIADFLNGAACQKYPAAEGEASLPVIKIRELNQGISEQTDRATASIPAKWHVADGDVLFSWSGSLVVTVWAGGPGALNQHLFKVTSTNYPKWFFLFWLREHLGEFQRIASGKATTMGHIQRHHLTQAKCAVPPASLMARAGALMAPLVARQHANDLESRTLATLRDTLLPKLISGELRVPDAEAAVSEAL